MNVSTSARALFSARSSALGWTVTLATQSLEMPEPSSARLKRTMVPDGDQRGAAYSAPSPPNSTGPP